MNGRFRGLSLALGLGCLSFSLPAAAGPRDAPTLLRDGKRLMAAGDLGQACPKLAESQSLAPSPTTLLQLAICHERQGKYATAYREFKKVLQQSSRHDAPGAAARSHIASLEPRVSYVTVKVPDTSDTKNWLVYVDGFPLEPSAWNMPQPIDPGSHKVSVSGSREPWSRTFAGGRSADNKTIELPSGKPESTAPAAPPPPKAVAAAAAAQSAQTEAKLEDPTYLDKAGSDKDKEQQEDRSKAGGAPVLGWALTAAGVGGIAVGTVFGVKAISSRKDSDRNCPNGVCTQAGVDANNRAKTAAWISNIGIGAGVVAAGFGLYLLFSSSSEERPEAEKAALTIHPEVTPNTAGITMRGAW